MITKKEQFIKIMGLMEKWNRDTDKLTGALGVGMMAIDIPCVEVFGDLFDLIIKESFDNDGCDLIYQWLYDDVKDSEKNIDDLWEKLMNNRIS